MKTPLDRARPLEITAKWRNGVRTPEWDRLWRRIMLVLLEGNRTIDQNTDGAVLPLSPSPNEVNNAD